MRIEPSVPDLRPQIRKLIEFLSSGEARLLLAGVAKACLVNLHAAAGEFQAAAVRLADRTGYR